MRKILKLLPIGALACFLIYLGLTFNTQRGTLSELEDIKSDKEAQLVQTNKEIKNLEKELEEVDSPEFIEKVAREKLKMVGPKDIVYVDESNSDTE